MAPDNHTNDYRRAVRLAVNGEISARMIASDQVLELRDIGPGGFLAETTADVPVDSRHHVRLVTENGAGFVLAVRCAHCRRSLASGAPRFVVGFAFLSPETKAIGQLLDQLIASITFH